MSLALCWLPPDDLSLDPAPPFRSIEGARTREALLAVVEQFQVEVAPRYQRRDVDKNGTVDTFCNFFARDVGLAMLGKDVWPRMLANDLHDWLGQKSGVRAGWVPMQRASEAFARVEMGHFVLAVHQAKGHGHVAVGVPQPALVGKVAGLRTAQAGRRNFSNGPIKDSFGALPFKLFAHA